MDFHFGVPNRSLYACKLIKKVTGMGLSVAVWSSDIAVLTRTYDDLWRFEDMTFIAHAWADTEYAADCSVVFSGDMASLPASDVIVLLDEAVPPGWQEGLSRFKRAVDIVDRHPELTQNARERYKIYRSSGVSLKAYDRSKVK